jgi:hypothetical protein
VARAGGEVKRLDRARSRLRQSVALFNATAARLPPPYDVLPEAERIVLLRLWESMTPEERRFSVQEGLRVWGERF